MSWDWTPDTLAALQRHLGALGITEGALTATAIGEGHSNLTFLVSDGARDVVVRRPPPPPVPPGANDMLREARMLAALQNTRVPVPRLLATVRADEVLDVAFYVMSFEPGPVITTRTPAPLNTPAIRHQIGCGLVDTLAALHTVDWRAVGLTDFGRPEGFNARHLQRMYRLLEVGGGTVTGDFDEIGQWLQAHTPPESAASVVHCDFRIGNVVMAADAPGRVQAVLDWELATLGDPLLDLGYLLATVPVPDRPPNPTAALSAAMLEDGYPDRAELVARYRDLTGANVAALDWYITLALWKLAVLYEYSRRRVLDGVGDPYYADPALVTAFLDDARRTAGITDRSSR